MLLVPRQSEREGARRRWALRLLALIAAFVAHGAMVLVLVLLSHLQLDVPRPPAPKASNKAVTLKGLTAADWAKNRGENRANVKDERKVVARATEKKPEPPKPPDPIPKGQVVATPKGNDQVDPTAKYLSESNNATKRETRAKEQTAFYKNAMSRATASHPTEGNGHDVAERAQVAGNDGLGDDDRPTRERASMQAMEIPTVEARQEVAVRERLDGPGARVSNRTESEAVRGNGKRLNLSRGESEPTEGGSGGRRGHAGTLNLMPSQAVLDAITGAAANDALKDVDEGEGTFLNTREWKYAAFFNRVKQSVGQNWNPQAQLRLRDPTMQIYGARDRQTTVAVTLSPEGRLVDAYIESSCGVDFLDLEAIKAFERAQPFPNPPPGLLAADHTVRFQFGFLIEMSGRPGLRLFRSAE